MKYYAIKRPDGSWVMTRPFDTEASAWKEASWHDQRLADIRKPYFPNGDCSKDAEAAGYRCVEVSGFREAEV